MNEELLKRLDVLAAKLGVTAQYLWTVLIHQARIEAITDTVFAVLCVAIVATYVVLLYRWIKRDSHGDWEMFAVIGGPCALGVAVFALCLVSSAITEWMNPEYFALTKVLEALK